MIGKCTFLLENWFLITVQIWPITPSMICWLCSANKKIKFFANFYFSFKKFLIFFLILDCHCTCPGMRLLCWVLYSLDVQRCMSKYQLCTPAFLPVHHMITTGCSLLFSHHGILITGINFFIFSNYYILKFYNNFFSIKNCCL